MPLIGHGLVGVGVGAATTADVRSPKLRHAWLGTAITLAYLPDLLEWLANLGGLVLPHSALAALPPTAVTCGVLLLLLRWGLNERGGIALAAAVTLVMSHMLLDLIDGGIPLWWPLARAPMGPDWIPNDADSLDSSPTRMIMEFNVFAPVAAAGAVVAVCRRRSGALAICAVLVALELMLVGSVTGKTVLTALFGAVVLVLALVAHRWRPRRQVLWQIVPLVPVLLLAGIQLYAQRQMRRGWECYREQDYAGAQQHFIRCARVRPLGLERTARHEVAMCYARLGQEETAHQLLLRELEEEPDSFSPLLGLTELYLTAQDERYRRPREALRLARRLVPAARDPGQREQARQLLERARRAAGGSE